MLYSGLFIQQHVCGAYPALGPGHQKTKCTISAFRDLIVQWRADKKTNKFNTEQPVLPLRSVFPGSYGKIQENNQAEPRV